MTRHPVASVLIAVAAIVGIAPASPLAAQLRAPAPASLIATAESPAALRAVADWVTHEVARRWMVDVHRVEIDWGDTPTRIRERAAAGAELVGGASAGWVVTLPAAGDEGARRLRIDAGLRTELPLAARELARGTELGDTDVAWVERVVPGPPQGAPVDPVGQRTRRRVATGEVLDGASVAPRPWIEARDPVEVVYEKGRVSIAMRGTALGEGLPGGTLHVRLEDGRRIQGRAVAPGRVALEAGESR